MAAERSTAAMRTSRPSLSCAAQRESYTPTVASPSPRSRPPGRRVPANYLRRLGFSFKWNMGWMNDTLVLHERGAGASQNHHDEMTFGLVYAFHENFVCRCRTMKSFMANARCSGECRATSGSSFANLRAYFGFMYGHPGQEAAVYGREIVGQREWNHDQSLDWHLCERPPTGRPATGARPEPDLSADAGALSSWISRAAVLSGSIGRIVTTAYFPGSGGRRRRPMSSCRNFTPVVRPRYRLVCRRAAYVRSTQYRRAEYGGSGIGSRWAGRLDRTVQRPASLDRTDAASTGHHHVTTRR